MPAEADPVPSEQRSSDEDTAALETAPWQDTRRGRLHAGSQHNWINPYASASGMRSKLMQSPSNLIISQPWGLLKSNVFTHLRIHTRLNQPVCIRQVNFCVQGVIRRNAGQINDDSLTRQQQGGRLNDHTINCP